jgi:hypothetical protein
MEGPHHWPCKSFRRRNGSVDFWRERPGSTICRSWALGVASLQCCFGESLRSPLDDDSSQRRFSRSPCPKRFWQRYWPPVWTPLRPSATQGEHTSSASHEVEQSFFVQRLPWKKRGLNSSRAGSRPMSVLSGDGIQSLCGSCRVQPSTFRHYHSRHGCALDGYPRAGSKAYYSRAKVVFVLQCSQTFLRNNGLPAS